MTVAIEIKDLRKTYQNGHQALKGIDLSVHEGDFFALLGQNGAGKSTTIGILTSLVIKSAGSITVLGLDFDEQPTAVKSYLSVVPQELNLNIFETPWRTLLFQAGYYGVPSKIAKVRTETLLKKLGLWPMRHQASRLLSGGMKRRLMIARSLVHEPKILILDEPTAGVDVEVRQEMWDFLLQLNRTGMTIILTTHYLEEAEMLCNRMAIIHEGKIVLTGGVRSLLDAIEFETLVLFLRTPLPGNFELSGFQYRIIDSTTLEVDLQKQHNLSELFAKLLSQHVEVSSMKNKMGRLEQLFFNLVGEKKTA